MEIKFLEKDQNYQNETTSYWFELDGEKYNMCDCNGDVRLYDSENLPMDIWGGNLSPDHDRIYNILYPEYKKQSKVVDW